MKAMIMAAGLGTRLLPLTETLSKPMVPVAGRPVMEHIVTLLARHGFTELCANLHYYPDEISAHFGDGSAFGVRLRYAFEQELSGTAGGVGRFRDVLGDGTFLIMSGDALTDIDLTSFMAAHRAHGGVCTIAVKKVDDPSRFGVVVHDEHDRITGFQEKPSRAEARSDLCSAGIYACEPEIFGYIPEGEFVDFAKNVFPALMAHDRPLHVWSLESYWNDVGSLDVYRHSNYDALSAAVAVDMPYEQIRRSVWVAPGAHLGDPAHVVPPVLVGEECDIAAGARLIGPVAIGAGCTVGQEAAIEGSIVWSGCSIGAAAQLHECVVGRRVEIGDHAVVGADAVVADGCRIGSHAVVEPGARLAPDTVLSAQGART
jgi:NDP-sugar pyrophosphorylase family protein